jgi:hypothetical protein
MMSLTVLLGLLSQFAIDVVGEPELARRIVRLWATQHLPDGTLEAYERCFKAPLEQLASR